WAGGDASGE
uniref:Delta sleep-inducing peptide n=1 Tax=Oryctolagus cuniculus TaxID=9986 RepID=DSIP_RABIT|nr:RecName: Full=Delta sleep-inducing peptide; Short=DSIP [Oryctolagus cuniculus]prf//0412267A delta sleep inducing peptide [Oryctolagus cuniculus]